MRRIRRLPVYFALAALLASTTAPVAAVELDATVGHVQVDVEVTGYVSGDMGGFAGRLACSGLDEPINFSIGSPETPTEPMAVPPGAVCWIDQFTGGDPGNLGQWGQWMSSGGVQAMAGGPVELITVTMEREYNGNVPPWDVNDWLPMEVFTVDRVYVNRSGGITAEGLAWCPSLAASPAGPNPIISIDWSATQYIGRKTAIHGSYVSDIGNFCYDPEHPMTPVRWRSMHPSGTEAVTAWVYGVDGKFASGTIIIDADSENDMSSITQGWDPDRDDYDANCTTEVKVNGGFDQNGDGFCAYSIWSGQRTTAAVKTTSFKGR